MSAGKPTPRRADSSANVAILHEVWKQAYASPEAFELPCGTEGDANRMRTSLYNAVRNVKHYPEDYPTMVDAVNNCEIVKHETDPSRLIIRKELSPRMLLLRKTLEARGVKIQDSALTGTPQQRELQASVEKMLKELGESDPAEATIVPRMTETRNPFFTRDKQ